MEGNLLLICSWTNLAISNLINLLKGKTSNLQQCKDVERLQLLPCIILIALFCSLRNLSRYVGKVYYPKRLVRTVSKGE